MNLKNKRIQVKENKKSPATSAISWLSWPAIAMNRKRFFYPEFLCASPSGRAEKY